jgi:hypothetical protein
MSCVRQLRDASMKKRGGMGDCRAPTIHGAIWNKLELSNVYGPHTVSTLEDTENEQLQRT